MSASGPASAGVSPDRLVARAIGATYVAFIGSGIAFASWAARIPQIRESLGVTPGQLGFIILCVAGGSIVSLPMSGLLVARLGEARTVAIMSLVLAVGLAIVGVGVGIGIPPVCVGLFLLGLGNGAWDVAMNVQGAAVERALGRSIMSRFHAGFSIGTVAGAGIGALLVALHVGVRPHLVAIAVLVALVVPVSVLRGFLPHAPDEHHASHRSVLRAWREPRTVLIGVFVLCMAFTEGTGNDWLGVAVIDGYHTSNALGVLTLAVFLTAMTLGRWFGPGILDRHGRVLVLRTSAVTAFAGLLVVVFAHLYAFALVGAVLWGIGTALGFPTGMSAAADDPRYAAARVSVVASIAYVAFLAGPPVIGFVGDHLGVLHALTVAAGLLAVAAAICGACAPLHVPDGAEVAVTPRPPVADLPPS
ncbi:MAG TPA: MFS transporter [Jatrophihabitantaceae bacterium]|jgi:predicted MFS family arabinose efflux permease